ncbi:hypothetical protein PFNF54_05598 [Plasmodium falciparum NF54]|uniref:Uncharacterized protein n=1 Tax=Plasmodium falciparum (isolate NF54) TaxID=5843 RepID=W7JXY2_PLAFO|nr:hypothetical protein PFNF54_05598 [Plasmodium falciparum NF54]
MYICIILRFSYEHNFSNEFTHLLYSSVYGIFKNQIIKYYKNVKCNIIYVCIIFEMRKHHKHNKKDNNNSIYSFIWVSYVNNIYYYYDYDYYY